MLNKFVLKICCCIAPVESSGYFRHRQDFSFICFWKLFLMPEKTEVNLRTHGVL